MSTWTQVQLGVGWSRTWFANVLLVEKLLKTVSIGD